MYNNLSPLPENIPRLQEIARKEAELHLVRAGIEFQEGKATEAGLGFRV